MNWNLAIVVLSISSLLGCTTMQAMNPSAADLTSEFQKGDQLVIRLNSGQVLEMTLVSFDGVTLRGVNGEPRSVPVEVPLSEVNRIELERVDGVQTAKVVGGIVLLVLVSALLVAGSGGYDFNWSGGMSSGSN